MKKNDWILLISTLAYSYLFYEQSQGLNYLLFNLVVIGLLIWRDRSIVKDRKWLSVAAGALVSSFCIFWYSSPLAIIANLFSLMILSALSLNSKTSFLASILLTVWSGISTVYFIPRDWIKRKREQISGEYARPFYVKFLLILVPIIIALLFFFMYQSANPLFYNFTKEFDLDFISFPWIMFTLGGLVILYGFFYNRRVQKILHADENARLELDPASDWSSRLLGNIMRTDTENISGLVLLLLLNGLLLLLNVLDLKYLWLDGTLPEGMKHKEFVHEGVGILITSILLAIFIILFYFRGALNFYEKNKWIRLLAYTWIVQNAFMVFSTAYRNNMYIEESGLSYKKIGVYVYLYSP